MTVDVEALRRAWREAEASFEAANEMPYPATDMAHSDWHRRREEACLLAVHEAAYEEASAYHRTVLPDVVERATEAKRRAEAALLTTNAERDAAAARAERFREALRQREREHLEAVAEGDELRADAKRLREALTGLYGIVVHVEDEYGDDGWRWCDVRDALAKADKALKPGPLFARRIPPC